MYLVPDLYVYKVYNVYNNKKILEKSRIETYCLCCLVVLCLLYGDWRRAYCIKEGATVRGKPVVKRLVPGLDLLEGGGACCISLRPLPGWPADTHHLWWSSH